MKFQIPLTFSEIEKLKIRSRFIASHIKYKPKSKLEENLKNSGIDISREEYIAICINTFFVIFIILFVVSSTVLIFLNIKYFYFLGFIFSLLFSAFVFFSQIVYPRIYVMRREKNIEKNLIPALQDILIQLSSGVPLFSVLVNISSADYGELSVEFKKAVRRISAGSPEQEVLEGLSKTNPSTFFKRTLWQISNGMNAGSDMTFVVEDSVKSLNEEQMIQIQNYGNKLNPLIVFYMLIAVIIPALSITFLTIISSMVNLSRFTTIILFVGLFIFVILMQIMFLGLIKSRRPSLM
ncbi:MAG: type II secretion system F family protein [Candidatus Nanoarchaeia archaeon]|nr:type II secretion system F family protein [Candidatus Nanoarchaeia archaeon]MDD5740626.1 type II secretion system F family protein [Candidatus Nanoarchaeia archaeon]